MYLYSTLFILHQEIEDFLKTTESILKM